MYLIPDPNTVDYICTMAAVLVVIIVLVPMKLGMMGKLIHGKRQLD